MNNWKIKALLYGIIDMPKGAMEGGLDPDMTLRFPYTGYLLQNGKENILVDTGIHADHIVDGRAWRGCPAEGGADYVLKALAEYGLTPDDIDTVIYTHLHNDHAGNALMFPNALTIYQKDEYANLVQQLPRQARGGDYDSRTPGDLAQLKHKCVIDGDVRMSNGLELYKTPGHSTGSMCIVVPTEEGRYVITGDMPHVFQSLFPKTDKWELLGGETIDVTPAPDNMLPFCLNSVIYDEYACMDSFYKIMLLAEKFEPKWYLTGHDMWVHNKKSFG